MKFPGEALIIKMWESLIDKGAGGLLSPWQIRREGRARNDVRAEELLMLARVEEQAKEIQTGKMVLVNENEVVNLLVNGTEGKSLESKLKVRFEPVFDIQSASERASIYEKGEKVRRQINISKAILHAEDILSQDEQVTTDKVLEDDWLYSWRDYAQKVSSEELQQLWGSVLAGEVQSPGTYSLRTLDFLRTISKDDAEKISKLASYVTDNFIIHGVGEQFGFGKNTDREFYDLTKNLEDEGLNFNFLNKMHEIGVLMNNETGGLSHEVKSSRNDSYAAAIHGYGLALYIKNSDPAKSFIVNYYRLTTVGTQILGLGRFSTSSDYLRHIGKTIKKYGFSVAIVNWKKASEKTRTYSVIEELQ